MSSGEHRIPSDTVRIDQAELDALVAKAKAEDTPTGVDCPACGAIVRDPPCAPCNGTGWVTLEFRSVWLSIHGVAYVVCPKCLGEGMTIDVLSGSSWHSGQCSLCLGKKSVLGHIASSYDRGKRESMAP